MEVQVISKTIQKFNDESFYLCGPYYQHKGKRLHRAVWEYHNGMIPKGYHVHHKNGDKSKNDIDNLELLKGTDHMSYHMSREERKAQSKSNIRKAQQSAALWHGSEKGAEWHSQRGKENWRVRKTQCYSCTYCGKPFYTKHIYGENKNHFCHPNCKASYRRQRIKNGEIKK